MNSPALPSQGTDLTARAQAAAADFGSENDPEKLARIIEHNRAILKQGWEELGRLSELLEKLDAQLRSACLKA